ncbi:peptidoglycan-recognition protein LF-like [Macrosteles quadrilineatus]|uniref:peptidoglycan-recognition protein LF-like n=1 Tax=Macrosteles quadrilineatus TaxID=74068 RepID=UPI0023E18138|nr:peptidoglycan-recognition protein LF-like [Macrosteles quadrilineatus]
MVPIPTAVADDNEQVLVTRKEWSSAPPISEKEGIPLKYPIPAVIFTYTETDVCNERKDCKIALNELQRKYKKDGLYDLPWNFVVGGDGTVYEARGWKRQPEPHPEFPEWAGKSLEIAHFGSTVSGVPPNDEQMVASWYIVNDGTNKDYIKPLPIRRTLFYTFPMKITVLKRPIVRHDEGHRFVV